MGFPNNISHRVVINSANANVLTIVAHRGKMLWFDGIGRALMRANLDGTQVETMKTFRHERNADVFHMISVPNSDDLYMSQTLRNKIIRTDQSGQEAAVIMYRKYSRPGSLAMDYQEE